MEVVGEFLEMDADKKIGEYFINHWMTWFPCLGSRTTFIRQAANLWKIKQQIQQALAETLGAYKDNVPIVDGHPIPVCAFKRARQSHLYKGVAN